MTSVSSDELQSMVDALCDELDRSSQSIAECEALPVVPFGMGYVDEVRPRSGLDPDLDRALHIIRALAASGGPNAWDLLRGLVRRTLPDWMSIEGRQECLVARDWCLEAGREFDAELARLLGESFRAAVVLDEDDLRPVTWRLLPGDNWIGRHPGCHLPLPVRGVSRIHGSIHVSSEIVLLPLESTRNAFVVNGSPTRTFVPLKDGDTIGVQSQEVLLRCKFG